MRRHAQDPGADGGLAEADGRGNEATAAEAAAGTLHEPQRLLGRKEEEWTWTWFFVEKEDKKVKPKW